MKETMLYFLTQTGTDEMTHLKENSTILVTKKIYTNFLETESSETRKIPPLY